MDDVRQAERELSEAYCRLRAMIPGAFNTPFAPTPREVWAHTEKCLAAALEKRDAEQPVDCQRPHWDGDYLLARIKTLKKQIDLLKASPAVTDEEVRMALKVYADACVDSFTVFTEPMRAALDAVLSARAKQ